MQNIIRTRSSADILPRSLGAGVEHRIAKPEVVGSNPTASISALGHLSVASFLATPSGLAIRVGCYASDNLSKSNGAQSLYREWTARKP